MVVRCGVGPQHHTSCALPSLAPSLPRSLAMAAVITTMMRARQQEDGAEKQAAPEHHATHSNLQPVLAIQRVFRGYRDRKRNSKSQLVIDPATMLVALDRHTRERKGFRRLCWFVLYLLLYVMVVWSRSHSTSRFHLESAVKDAISGVTTPSGVTIASAASPSDVYADNQPAHAVVM